MFRCLFDPTMDQQLELGFWRFSVEASATETRLGMFGFVMGFQNRLGPAVCHAFFLETWDFMVISW